MIYTILLLIKNKKTLTANASLSTYVSHAIVSHVVDGSWVSLI